MLSDKRVKETESNVKKYLADGLLKKQTNETAKEMYIENGDLSLETAQKLLSLENQTYQPYLWVIVSSYYAMYYPCIILQMLFCLRLAIKWEIK